MANTAMQGYGLLNRMWGWVDNFVGGGAKAAIEKGSAADQSLKANLTNDFNTMFPDATEADIQRFKGSLDAHVGGSTDAIRRELDKNSTGRKIGTVAKVAAAGTALVATGLAPTLISSAMTTWENSKKEAGANSWFFGIFNFLAQAMEVFGLDKKMPGAYKWLVDRRDGSNGTVGNLAKEPSSAMESAVEHVKDNALTYTALGLGGLGARHILKNGNPFSGSGKGPGGGGNGPTGGGKPGVVAAEAGEVAADASKIAARGGKFGKIAAGIGILGGGAIAGMTLGPSSAEAATPIKAGADVASETSTGLNAFMGGVTGLTAIETAKGASLIANGGGKLLAMETVQFAGKRLPGVGGLVTVGFSAFAAGSYALNGEFGRAAAEMGTGVVEGLVNATGLGLVGAGDAAREGLRATFSAVAGEEYAPDKSGIRSIVEWTTGTGDFAPNPLKPPALA